MEIAGRTLRARVEQALVVCFVLLAFQYYRDSVDWWSLLAITGLVFLITIPLDAARSRFEAEAVCERSGRRPDHPTLDLRKNFFASRGPASRRHLG